MLIIDNKYIETSIKDLLELLQQQLAIKHINKLDKIDYKQNNARVTCPIHSGGHERTPSCFILLEDKDNVPAGTVKCFGCGYKTNFIRFVADCLEINYRKASEWILSVSKYSLLELTRLLNNISLNSYIKDMHVDNQVTPSELRQYDYIHKYMYKRKLTDNIIEKFEVGYDPKVDAITFPVYVDGICRFVCKRYVKFKRFDMPKDITKPVYGLDYLTGEDVYICESVINALTLWTWGYQAVALFGTGTEHQVEILKGIQQRRFILCLDGDNAGKAGTKKLLKELNNKIITYKVLPSGKDINDLTKEEFEKLEEKF